MTDLWRLLTDPAHWAFELLSEGPLFLLEVFVLSLWVRHHDRRHHAN